jgi:hypothetical protein
MLVCRGFASRKLLPQRCHGTRRLGKALQAICFPLPRLHRKLTLRSQQSKRLR